METVWLGLCPLVSLWLKAEPSVCVTIRLPYLYLLIFFLNHLLLNQAFNSTFMTPCDMHFIHNLKAPGLSIS